MSGQALRISVEDLHVRFRSGRTTTHAVRGATFSLQAGQCLAIVGESGSGKSVTARSLVGLAGEGAQVSAARLQIAGRDALSLRARDWRTLRGKDVGLVLQDALVSLDPLRRIGREVGEALAIRRELRRDQIPERVRELLVTVGISDADNRARQYPHQLSGGLRQRALIASAIAARPGILIADEPTTALDVTVQAQVLDLLQAMTGDGTALLLISHDLAVVARLADTIAVMNNGIFVETGSAQQVLTEPKHPYTKALLAAVPAAHAKGTRLSNLAPITISVRTARQTVQPRRIEARHVTKSFHTPDGGRLVAVNDVSFTAEPGTTLGIVGESGSGKSTLARIVLGLSVPDSGNVRVGEWPWSEWSERQRRAHRHTIQAIYQDPLSSFDPRWTVARTLHEALTVAGVAKPERPTRALELLRQVGLDQGHLNRRPLELSGGQRQRIAIARALAPAPSILVCDEPVSALDVSIQAQVLDMLTDLQARLGFTMLFISHDLGVVQHVSDQILVMKSGRIVEEGNVSTIFGAPRHAYTEQLIASIPHIRPSDNPARAIGE